MKPLISSVRIEIAGAHAHIGVWSRGGKAGTLIVDKDDTLEIALLFGEEVPVYFSNWVWHCVESDHTMWFGTRQAPDKNHWELRVYNGYWEAWLESQDTPLNKVSSDFCKDYLQGIFAAQNYVNEIEENIFDK